jgi:hypothetical protein
VRYSPRVGAEDGSGVLDSHVGQLPQGLPQFMISDANMKAIEAAGPSFILGMKVPDVP